MQMREAPDSKQWLFPDLICILWPFTFYPIPRGTSCMLGAIPIQPRTSAVSFIIPLEISLSAIEVTVSIGATP